MISCVVRQRSDIEFFLQIFIYMYSEVSICLFVLPVQVVTTVTSPGLLRSMVSAREDTTVSTAPTPLHHLLAPDTRASAECAQRVTTAPLEQLCPLLVKLDHSMISQVNHCYHYTVLGCEIIHTFFFI